MVTVHAGGKTPIPSAGSVLRELRTPKIRVWSRSLNPIDSIGWLLSIIVGLNLPAEGIRPKRTPLPKSGEMHDQRGLPAN